NPMNPYAITNGTRFGINAAIETLGLRKIKNKMLDITNSARANPRI
ncbi:unnamed protein product, partial [marine sediment metagenome]